MQECPVPQVEGAVVLRDVVTATACPTDTKDRLDRRNQGTEGVTATEQEVGDPTGTVKPVSVVDFRQVVGPMQNLMHRSAFH